MILRLGPRSLLSPSGNPGRLNTRGIATSSISFTPWTLFWSSCWKGSPRMVRSIRRSFEFALYFVRELTLCVMRTFVIGGRSRGIRSDTPNANAMCYHCAGPHLSRFCPDRRKTRTPAGKSSSVGSSSSSSSGSSSSNGPSPSSSSSPSPPSMTVEEAYRVLVEDQVRNQARAQVEARVVDQARLTSSFRAQSSSSSSSPTPSSQ